MPPAGQFAPGGSATTTICGATTTGGSSHFGGVRCEGSQPGGPSSLPGGRSPASTDAGRYIASVVAARMRMNSRRSLTGPPLDGAGEGEDEDGGCDGHERADENELKLRHGWTGPFITA